MQWKFSEGFYLVTICGLMSWKFTSLHDGFAWAFITKEARDVADELDGIQQ
ncbi:hypothetical protein [Hafnia alvei]|uniref:hypothetical protein n=1 Tax=Hafnia alvei TaxID=569 RepID=UPI00187D4C71|nr:hypothetical protein [Hafnia alvei]